MKLSETSVVNKWSEAPWTDYFAAIIIVAIHIAIVWTASEVSLFDWPADTQRLAIYNSGATIVSIIVGLTATAIPVYLAASGERARTIRKFQSGALRKNWRTLLAGMGIAAGLCLLAQVVDRPATPELSWYIFELGILIAVTKFVRLVWLFNEIIRIADRDLTDQPRKAPPPLSDSWKNIAS